MTKITLKFLKDRNACTEGYKWFKKNYPDGLVITKKNMEIFIKKLRARRGEYFGYCDTRIEDVTDTLDWLIDSLARKACGGATAELLSDANCSAKDLLNAFWKDYKEIINIF